MFKNKKDSAIIIEEQSEIQKLLKPMKNLEVYIILDDNNAITIEKIENKKYELAHVKLENGKLNRIFSWNQDFYKENNFSYAVDPELGLFVPSFKVGLCPFGVYNYKLGKIIASPKDWEQIHCANIHGWETCDNLIKNGLSYLQEYKGLLVEFTLCGGTYCGKYYHNPVVKTALFPDSIITKETFFAIVNPDGTIRGNKLFLSDIDSRSGKGTFSKITNIIDLSDYVDLNDFKQQRTSMLSKKHQSRVEKYNNQRETESPYLDEKVYQIIKI